MTAPAAMSVMAIIQDGLRDAAKIQRGQVPDGEQIAESLRRLTDIVNFEQTQGLKLFLLTDHSVTLVAGTQTYTITVSSVKPLRVIQGYYLDSDSNRRPMYPLSWDEWLRLSNVTQQGQITQYFVNKQSTTLTVSFWLTPDTVAATGTAHLLTQRQVTDPISLTENMEFPVEWRMFLRWALADEVATGQPQAIVQRCQQNREMYRAALEAWDVEDAPTMLQIDSRYQNMSTFR